MSIHEETEAEREGRRTGKKRRSSKRRVRWKVVSVSTIDAALATISSDTLRTSSGCPRGNHTAETFMWKSYTTDGNEEGFE